MLLMRLEGAPVDEDGYRLPLAADRSGFWIRPVAAQFGGSWRGWWSGHRAMPKRRRAAPPRLARGASKD